ncbi:MAG: 3-phosphoshikimate 1-carboxyvinyltransferase [bacterium]
MKTLTISKPDKKLKGRISLPTSKSVSNRLLIMQAISGLEFPVEGLSGSDDTMLLQKLISGIKTVNATKRIIELDTQNAGTVMRFLTAVLSIRPGKWILTGSERMKQRPVWALVDALRDLGADIEYLSRIGFPPLLIKGKPLPGGETAIESGVSSQFCSALLMIAPYLPEGMVIHLKGQAVSVPYIDMTLRMMEHFGARLRKTRHQIRIRPGVYLEKSFTVEADWSAASFWYEAAALADEVDLELIGLKKESSQGDSILAKVYHDFGVNTEYTAEGVRLTRSRKKIDGYYFNFSDYPDIAPPVITTCALLGLRGRFEGLMGLKIKETNRLLALKNEFEKLGLSLSYDNSQGMIPVLDLKPSKLKTRIEQPIETYGDHRMAMTFAPVALKTGSIRITNPDVVGKSYPDFWTDLESVGFELR